MTHGTRPGEPADPVATDPHPPAGPSDAELLRAVAAGHEAAFVELYRRRRHDVYRVGYALSRSAAMAQDAVQDVFLAVLENAASFDAARGTARGWLLACARHAVVSRLRGERRFDGEPPEQAVAAGHDESILQGQRSQRLHAAIVALPLEFREALVLCDLEELTYAECAVVLGCPVGTVRSRLHRARALLAARLAGGRSAAVDDSAAADAGPASAVGRPVLNGG